MSVTMNHPTDNETITVSEVLDYTREHHYESISYNSNSDSSPYEEPRVCFSEKRYRTGYLRK